MIRCTDVTQQQENGRGRGPGLAPVCAAVAVPPASVRSHRRALTVALWLTVGLRLALEVVAVMALALDPRPLQREIASWTELEARPAEGLAQLLAPWQRWDALWYQRIAEHGYGAGDATGTFFPLYPLLARLTAVALRDVVLAELVLSTLAFCIGVYALHRLVSLHRRPRVATLAVLLLVFFPTGFYLHAPYTESLFLAVTVVAFWGLATRRSGVAAVAAGLAALTRPHGVLLALPLAIAAATGPQRPAQRAAWLAASFVPVAAFAGAVMAPMVLAGERSTAFALQGRWGARTVQPWEALADSAAHIARTGDPIETLNLVSLVGFTLLAMVVWRTRAAGEAAYVTASLLVLSSRELANLSPLMSVSRYVIVLFPCFIAAATVLERRPALAAAILVIGAYVQVLLFTHFVRWGFVA
jgi:hypothetical protein